MTRLVWDSELAEFVIAPVEATAKSCECDSLAGCQILCVSDMTRVTRDTVHFPRVQLGINEVTQR